ncbi:AMP-binding protein [Haliangium ochraceum]|uniref:AMP-dependent synthetase and ligase n=1 Tax=Haliangium ochraceum (strain DSM 14365 / JCM 11303 / SMP-2) TaxID=502025 RepID=D0LWZ7_HALO1|nr:AMP-binding protein [Haliangium ochraceum]ACY14244.1 AMP-dependent synthetase and ligase [Haliangium ochraceum DSM 14365]
MSEFLTASTAAQHRASALLRTHHTGLAGRCAVVVPLSGNRSKCALRADANRFAVTHPGFRLRLSDDDRGAWLMPQPSGSDVGGFVEVLYCSDVAAAQRALVRPFDLARGPALRVIAFGSARRRAIVVAPAAIADEHSLRAFANAVLTPGEPPPPPGRLARPGDDEAAAEALRAALVAEAEADRRAATPAWARALAARPCSLALPTLHRPATRHFGRRVIEIPLPQQDVRTLLSSVADAGAGPNDTAAALTALLLYRYGQREPVLGLRSRLAAPHILGPLSDITVLAVAPDSLGELTPVELAAALHVKARRRRQARRQRRAPSFATLLERLGGSPEPPFPPLCQVLVECLTEAGCRTTQVYVHDEFGDGFELPGEFDLRVQLCLGAPSEQDAPALLRVFYDPNVFDHWLVAQFARHWRDLLSAAVAQPRQVGRALPLGGARDNQQRARWHDTARDYSEHPASLLGLLEAQAQRAPDAVAVVFDTPSGGESMHTSTLTHRALHTRAEDLAATLQARGLGPGDVVSVGLERSLSLAVALLATLKIGGVYLIVDPELSAAQIAAVLADARPSAVLTEARLAARFGDAAPSLVFIDQPSVFEATQRTPQLNCADADTAATAVADADADADADAVAVAVADSDTTPVTSEFSARFDPAPGRSVGADAPLCLLYRVDDDGAPVAAITPHGAMRNRLLWMQETCELGPTTRLLQQSSLRLDASGWALWQPLIAGGCAVFAALGGYRDLAYLRDLVVRAEVTVLHFTPSMLMPFLDRCRGTSLHSLRRVLCGGEAVCADHVRAMYAVLPRVALHNLTGSAETAMVVAATRCTAVEPEVPLGKPIANTQIHLFDEDGMPVPCGVPGTIYVGGAQVARGYHGRPEQTAARFVPNPSADTGERLFRTPHRAWRRPDGTLLYAGRAEERPAHAMAPSAADQAADQDKRPRLPGVASASESGAMSGATNATTGAAASIHDVGRSIASSACPSAVRARSQSERDPLLVSLHSPATQRDARAPSAQRLWLIAPETGRPSVYEALSGQLASMRPEMEIWGLRAWGLRPHEPALDDVATMAARYIQALRSMQPSGPYHLAGWSFGGVVTLEMARQLEAGGEAMGLVAVLDSWYPLALGGGRPQQPLDDAYVAALCNRIYGGLRARTRLLTESDLAALPPAQQLACIFDRALGAAAFSVEERVQRRERAQAVWLGALRAVCAHSPSGGAQGPAYRGRVVAVRPRERHRATPSPTLIWTELALQLPAESTSVLWVPGTHYTCLLTPHVRSVARVLIDEMSEIERRGASLHPQSSAPDQRPAAIADAHAPRAASVASGDRRPRSNLPVTERMERLDRRSMRFAPDRHKHAQRPH